MLFIFTKVLVFFLIVTEDNAQILKCDVSLQDSSNTLSISSPKNEDLSDENTENSEDLRKIEEELKMRKQMQQKMMERKRKRKPKRSIFQYGRKKAPTVGM